MPKELRYNLLGKEDKGLTAIGIAVFLTCCFYCIAAIFSIDIDFVQFIDSIVVGSLVVFIFFLKKIVFVLNIIFPQMMFFFARDSRYNQEYLLAYKIYKK